MRTSSHYKKQSFDKKVNYVCFLLSQLDLKQKEQATSILQDLVNRNDRGEEVTNEILSLMDSLKTYILKKKREAEDKTNE